MKITLKKDIEKIVVVTEDHGGFLEGECIACDETGWIDGKYGYRYGVKGVPGNHLIHKKNCVMNKFLNIDGTLKK